MTDLANEKYISLTTFTKDGRPKPLPVWVADVGGRLCFFTDDDSWKVRRMRNTSKVEIVPCDMKGNVTEGAEPVSGRAELIPTDGPAFQEIATAVKAKYGFWGKVFWYFGKLRNKPQIGVAITLD